MTASPLATLWYDLWADVRAPGLLWQVLALVLCIALGWGLAGALRNAFSKREAHRSVVRLGVESFDRTLAPLLALGLIAIAKSVLTRWQHVNLIRIAIPLLGSFALIRFAFYVLQRIFVRGGRAGSVLQLFEKAIAALVWAGVALYITGLWPDLLQYLEGTTLPLGRHQVSLLAMSQAVVSVVVLVLLALWAGAVLEERLMRVETMHSSLRAITARIGRALLVLVAVLVSFSLVGIDLTVLSVFGGALGVGLGLGLQKIASSYVSGFVILLERSLSVGDMVSVDKYYGKVTQINARYTVLQGLDGVESLVPNEMLTTLPLQNYSLSDHMLCVSTQVTVDYQSDVDTVSALMEQAAATVTRVLKAPAPAAALAKFGDCGLVFELLFWIADPENGRLSVISDVNKAVWGALQAHQIKVPLLQRWIGQVEALPGAPLPKS